MSLTPYNNSPERMEEDDASEVIANLNDEFVSVNGSENGMEAESMPIYLRIRGLLAAEFLEGYHECFEAINDTTVRCTTPAEHEKKHGQQIQQFTFSHAFGKEVTQNEIFEVTMQESVQNFIEGQNCLIFAYGNSGSGKTYTMHGSLCEPGIIPLTVQLLFDCIKNKQLDKPCVKSARSCDIVKVDQTIYETDVEMKNSLLALAEQEDYNKTTFGRTMGDTFERSSSLHGLPDKSILESSKIMKDACEKVILQGTQYYSVWCSFVEIYNEKIYDLLQCVKKKRSKLSLGFDSNGNTYVKDAKEVLVQSSDEVLKILAVGRKNLKIASTKLNYQSSRSHCIFTVKLVRSSDQHNPSSVGINHLSFCDLAGSERHCKTQNVGVRLKEAGNINTSLMVLGRCLEALRINQTQKEKKLMVPFRESQLTRLFADFFSGKGRASMIVNISPSSYTFNETLNVLKFSALAKQVLQITDLPVANTSTVQQMVKKWARVSLNDDDPSNISIVSIPDYSNEDLDVTDQHAREIEERDHMISEILSYALSVEKQLHEERQEKLTIEERTRSAMKQAYAEIMERKENLLKNQYERYKSSRDAIGETRWRLFLKEWHGESDESEESDSESEEKGDEHSLVKVASIDGESSATINAQVEANEKVELEQTSTSTKLEELTNELAKALSEKEEFEKLCAQLKSELKIALDEKELKENQENDMMCERLEEMKSQLVELETSLKEREETLCERNQEIEQLNSRLLSLNKELSEASAKLNNMEIEMKEKEYKYLQENRAYQDEITDLSHKNERLEGIIKMKVDELSQKEKELQNASTREACKTSKIEDLQNTASHLQEKLIASEANVRKAKENEKAYLNEISEEKLKSSKLAERLNFTERKLEELETEKKNGNITSPKGEESEEEKCTQENAAASSVSGSRSPIMSDEILELEKQVQKYKRKIEEKQQSEDVPAGPSLGRSFQQTHSLRERVSDPAWKAALIPKRRRQSLPWRSKFIRHRDGVKKDYTKDILNICQLSEYKSFKEVERLKGEYITLQAELSGEVSNRQRLADESKRKKSTVDVAVETDMPYSTVDVAVVTKAFQELIDEQTNSFLNRHSAVYSQKDSKGRSRTFEHIDFTKYKTGISEDTSRLLSLIQKLKSIVISRIQELQHDAEEKSKELNDAKEEINALSEELSRVTTTLNMSEENHRNQITALKEDSKLKMKALTSEAVVRVTRLDKRKLPQELAEALNVSEEKSTESSETVKSKKRKHAQERSPTPEELHVQEPLELLETARVEDDNDSQEDEVVVIEEVVQDEVAILEEEEEEEEEEARPPLLIRPRGRPPKTKTTDKVSKNKSSASDSSKQSETSNASKNKKPKKTAAKAKSTVTVSQENTELPEVAEEPKSRSGRSLRPRRGASAAVIELSKKTRATNKRKIVAKEPEADNEQPSSPLDRVLNFVSGARSKIKAATAYLSPMRNVNAAVASTSTAQSTPVLNKRRKKVLYRPEAEPVLDVSPPPENQQTPACDAKETVSELKKQIQAHARRQRR